MRFLLPALSLFLGATFAAPAAELVKPFLIPRTATTGWVIGNGLWNITIGDVYGKKLFYGGRDLIGDAVGHYSGYDGEANFAWTSASIYQETNEYVDIVFTSDLIDLHWVLTPSLPGAYQYIINKSLPELGVLRTLFRLSNTTFTHGRTPIKDEPLPSFADILSGTKVQDETFQRPDGTYITKYDWSTFIREIDFHGVYGEGFGSWYIRPGRDYLNGNQLKQELTVHRETKTGDAVELNVVHGSHFQVSSQATFPAGKIWGPWLWYLNDGSKEDAAIRSKQEFSAWPYPWLNNTAYQSRSSISGKLTLSDGKPAAGASIFLGDNRSNLSTLDQGANYQYTSTADSRGNFRIDDVRTGIYTLSAWGNGGSLSAVTTTFALNDIVVREGKKTALGNLSWKINTQRKRIFQIGALDRKALGFKNGGAPYTHGLAAQSPANLTYTIGKSNESEWYYASSALGSWTVVFDVPKSEIKGNRTAVLTISLAGWSQSSNLDVSLNESPVASFVTKDLQSDPALYRSGTTAGEWRFYEFGVGAGTLREGENKLVFKVTRFTLWRGYLWDSVLLEWSS
ncbi:polysaccharide lyase family 4 protein [Leptodontidium sp. MPI-SDFR-AT-0119]|nr:polysaccharide lyase family 4 protein [Leptodontidium sp. MPI-SDFR-AT-0119]